MANVPNPVTLSLTPIGTPSSKLRGYSYTTNNVTTKKIINATNSYTFSISNLRDPGARIVLYGSGTKRIAGGSATAYGYLNNGTQISATMTVSVTPNSFSYPGSVTITPSLSGSGSGATFDSFNKWIVYWGNVSFYTSSDNSPSSFDIVFNYDSEISEDIIYFLPISFSAHYELRRQSDEPVSVSCNGVTGWYESPKHGKCAVLVSGTFGKESFSISQATCTIQGNFYYQWQDSSGDWHFESCSYADVWTGDITLNYETITEQGTLYYP